MKEIIIRNIQPTDNPFLSKIIKNALEEFGANHPGTVYYDASTDSLSELFKQKGSAYFVAELAGEIVGGGGIFPTEGLPADTCELVKMYLGSCLLSELKNIVIDSAAAVASSNNEALAIGKPVKSLIMV